MNILILKKNNLTKCSQWITYFANINAFLYVVGSRRPIKIYLASVSFILQCFSFRSWKIPMISAFVMIIRKIFNNLAEILQFEL